MSPLFSLGQSLLLALDPERAHNLTIKTLEMGIYPSCRVPDDARLRQTLCGLEFPNPIGIAPGFDKNAQASRRRCSIWDLDLSRWVRSRRAPKAAMRRPACFALLRTEPWSTGSASTMKARPRLWPASGKAFRASSGSI